MSQWKGDPDLYLTVRFRLDQLQYTEYLSHDSVDLVQRLLSDLIQTTESCRTLRSSIETLSNEKTMAQEQLVPLKQELARITGENNQLHMDFIQLSDERDKRERYFENQTRLLEKQAQELKFLNAQYALQVETEKKRADQAQQKVEELFGRTSLNQDKKEQKAEKIFQRLQKIDIETGLEPLEHTPSYFTPPDPFVADALKIAQVRIDNLEQLVHQAQSKESEAENEKLLAREQLSKREREIARLQTQLEIARTEPNYTYTPKSPGRGEGLVDLQAARDRVEQLEAQIEYLQEHIESLEKDLGAMEKQQGTVHASILQDKDMVARELMLEKEKVKELTENMSKLESMIEELNALKNGPKGAFSREKLSLTITKHVKKISELTDALKAAELKLETNNKRIQMSQKELTRVKQENQQLKDKLKDSQKETDKKQILKQSQKDNQPQPTTTADPAVLEALRKENELLKSQQTNTHWQLQDATSILEQNKLKIDTLDTLLSTLKQSNATTKQELEHVTRERDALLRALESFETQLLQFQSQIQSVTAERDNALNLYRQLVASKETIVPTPVAAQAAQAVVQETEKQKMESEAQTDTLKDNSQEIHSLKLKNTELSQEIQKLQQDLQSMVKRQRETGVMANEALVQVEIEVDEIKKSLQDTLSEKQALEQELKTTLESLQKLNEEKESLEIKYENHKIRISGLEIELDEQRLKQRETVSKLTISETKNEKMEQQLEHVNQKLLERERQLGEQRELIEMVDKERDRYQKDLDLKQEQLTELSDRNNHFLNELKQRQNEIVDLKTQVDTLTGHLNAQDRECHLLTQQVQESTKIKTHLQNQVQRTQEELSALSADIQVLTRENQILNSETQKVANDRDQYRAELRECERQLHYLDNLIRKKDDEAQQLMISHRKLIAEHEKTQVVFVQSQEDLKASRMELILRDKQIQHLQLDLDTSAQTINKLKIDLNAYEKQTSNLTRTLATNDRQLRHLDQEKQRLMRDIAAARDLAHSLDRGKDGAQKQLMQLSVENERLNKQVDKLQSDQEGLLAQMQAEKLKLDRLEHLLAIERTKKMHSEKSVNDMTKSQTQREMQLSHLVDEQQKSLQEFESQIAQLKDELSYQKQRIQTLEQLLADKHLELEQLKASQHQIQDTNESLSQEVQVKNQVIQEMMSLQEPKSAAFDQRLQDEMEATKRELAHYEKEISYRIDQEQDQKVLETLSKLDL